MEECEHEFETVSESNIGTKEWNKVVICVTCRKMFGMKEDFPGNIEIIGVRAELK